MIEDLVDIFGEIIDLSGVEIDENTVLGDDILIDSMDMMRIISRIETAHKLRFSPEDIIELRTIGDIRKIINRHLRINKK